MTNGPGGQDWVAAIALPNIELHDPIEGGPVALVPRGDGRAKHIRASESSWGGLPTRLGWS